MLFFHREQHHIQNVLCMVERFFEAGSISISSLYIGEDYDDAIIFWRQDCWIYIFQCHHLFNYFT